MFNDSALESSWTQRSRRSWMTLGSLAMQALAVGLLLVFSVTQPVGLPLLRQLSLPVTLGPPPGSSPITQRARATRTEHSNLRDNVLIAPREVPRDVAMVSETVPPPQLNPGDYGVEGGTGTGSRMGVPGSIADSFNREVVPPPPVPAVRAPRVSHMMEGNLIYRVQPEYPTLAKSARVQGTVVLFAVISKEGTIENLRLLSGPPMLAHAALDAVSRWRYRPYLLNNEPVEVETRIIVNFSLSGN